ELARKYGSEEYGEGTVKVFVEAALFEMRNLAVGKQAPDIEGEDIDGSRFQLSDYRGKVVMLTFWGNWCGSCRGMVPHERSLVKNLEGRPFVLLGVTCDPDRAGLKEVVKKEEITWRSFWDGDKIGGGPI